MPRVQTYEELRETGIGGYLWADVFERDHGINRALVLMVPDLPDRPDKAISVHLYPSHEEGHWTTPGDVNGWDGNEDLPTFNPSIWVNNRKGWHRFLQRVQLVEA